MANDHRADKGRGLAFSRSRVTLSVAVVAFVWMAALASRYPYFDWDPSVAGAVQAISLPGFRTLMIWISAIGSGWLSVAVVAAVGVALLLMKRKAEAAICVAGAGLGAGANRLLKAVISRPRPSGDLVEVVVQAQHESFPSGHTVFFVELFGFLLLVTYLLVKRTPLRIALFVIFGALILLVGLSRIHLGAHWPSDVTGGYLLGGIWLSFMVMAYRRLKRPPRSEDRNT